MWNLSFTPPVCIEARVLTSLPASFRRPLQTEWSRANKPGQALESFLEGPSFDREGMLWVTDIPNGRIFRIDAKQQWTLALQYDGWPNGTAFHANGQLWIADYRRGLVSLDVRSGQLESLLATNASESFKGINDLTFNRAGELLFTDQGQTGMHDPTGIVYRWEPQTGRLTALLRNAPSPNGLAMNAAEDALFLAVTRANAVWRMPVFSSGHVSKVGVFRPFFGTSGPDGVVATSDGGVIVAHASLGGAFIVNARGEVSHFIKSPKGGTVTNLAFRPGTQTLVMTESLHGDILEAEVPVQGTALYSHAQQP